jgi:hypothetical protein
MKIFNIFMNNMVSVEAPKVLQYWITVLPMVVPCVQTNVVWFIIDQNGPQKVIRTV